MKNLRVTTVCLPLVGILVLGCGGTVAGSMLATGDAGGGSASVTGSAEGEPIPTTSIAAIPEGSSYVLIVMSSLEGACAKWQAGGGNEPGLRTFSLGIAAGMQPLSPGTYAIQQTASTQPEYASVIYRSSDNLCQQANITEADSGSVTLQIVSASVVSGTFDVTLYTGEHVSGTFSAPICELMVPADAGPAPCGK